MRKLKLLIVMFLATLVAGTDRAFAQAMPMVSDETTVYEYYIQQDVQAGSDYVTNQLRDDHIVAYGTSGEYLRVKFVAVEGSTEWKVVPLNVTGMGIIAISGNGDGAAATYYADEAAADAAGATLKTWMVTNSTICASGSQMGWNRYASGGLVKLYGWGDDGTQWRFIPANQNALNAASAGYASYFSGDLTPAAYNEWYNAQATAPAATAISVPTGYYRLRNAERATFHAYVYNDGTNTRAQVPNTSELVKNTYVWKVTHESGSATVTFQDAHGEGIWGHSSLTLGVSDFWKDGIVYFTEGMHVSNQSHLTVNGGTNATPAATQANPFKTSAWNHKDSKGSAYYFEPVEISSDVYAVVIEHGYDDSYITRKATAETASNGGFFVYAKDVAPEEDGFTASEVKGASPEYTIDSSTKTITVTYKATVDETVFALYEKANHQQTILDGYSVGNRPGQFPESLKTAAQQKIDAAWAVGNAAEVSAAEAALDAAMEEFTDANRNQIETGVAYMFLSAHFQNDNKAMYSSSSDSDLRWGDKNVANNSYYWKLTAVEGGGYKVLNGDGTYFGVNGSDFIMVGADNAGTTLFSHILDDEWEMNIAGAGNAHANSWSGGNGGTVIPWGSGEKGNASSWTLAPVSGYDIYDVEITSTPADADVEISYLGKQTSHNGGFFVIPTGTEPTAADFNLSVDYAAGSSIAIEGNTIKVTCSKAASRVRRESMPLPGNTYMIFNAGTVDGADWTGMLHYDGGVKVDKSNKPSCVSSITDSYKWTVTKDATGYKLYSVTNSDAIAADGVLNGENMVFDQYNLADRKCGDDVLVLLEDEVTRLKGSVTNAEHRVFTIRNTQNSHGWAVNNAGMVYRDNGFFPFAFYTTYKYTDEQWALYTEAKALIDKAGLVGCPAEDNAVGGEIKSLLCADPATADWETDLTAKIAAYKAVGEVVLPASGWYKIKNKALARYLFSESNDNPKHITYINNGGDNSKYYWYVTFNNGQATITGTTGLSMAKGNQGARYAGATTIYISPIALQSAQNDGVSWTEGYFLFPDAHSTNNSAYTRKNEAYNSETNPNILTQYSTTNTANQYTFEAVEVAEDNIYTVVVSGYSGKELPAVTYTVEGYTGNAIVYNGGKYFLETAPTKDDFTVSELKDYSSTVTVEGNTINVVYTYTGEMTYLPLKRATEIVAGKTYMIYNATVKVENGTVTTDYTGFILNNGASVRLEKSKPAAFAPMDKNALWTVVEADGTKYLQSLADNQYVSGTGGLSAEAQEINIDGYTDGDVTRLDSYWGFKVELEDGTWGDITEDHGLYALHDASSSWNGANDGSNFMADTQNKVCMPFAFYEVGEYTSWALQLYEEAKEVVAKEGKVGYPKAGNTTGAEIKQLLATDPATEEGWATTLQAKVDAYKAITDVQMPEDGKAYVITNVRTDGTAEYKKHLNYNVTSKVIEFAERGTGNANDLGSSSVFVCAVDGNNYTFVNDNGCYLALRQTSGGYNENRGYAMEYNDYTKATLESSKQKFGCIIINLKRGDRDAIVNMVLDKNTSTGFNQGGGPYNTSTLSSQFMFEEVTDPRPTVNVTAALNDGKYVATYSTVFPTVVPEGVVAYGAATQTPSANATTVTMQPMAIAGEAIPANTGVLLVAEGTTTLSPADMKPATTEVKNEVYPETNLFVGTGNTGATVDADVNAFILADGGSGVGFYKLSSTAREIAAYRAYLAIPTAAEIRNLHISFGDGSATAIETVEADAAGQPMYDLSGRRVVNPVKGSLYIKNGKKYIYK